jgi:hypothetical protein
MSGRFTSISATHAIEKDGPLSCQTRVFTIYISQFRVLPSMPHGRSVSAHSHACRATLPSHSPTWNEKLQKCCGHVARFFRWPQHRLRKRGFCSIFREGATWPPHGVNLATFHAMSQNLCHIAAMPRDMAATILPHGQTTQVVRMTWKHAPSPGSRGMSPRPRFSLPCLRHIIESVTFTNPSQDTSRRLRMPGATTERHGTGQTGS